MEKRILKMHDVTSDHSEATHVKVQLYYSKGGMNYFTGKAEARGYYVSVSPVKIEVRDGWRSETTSAFSGIKECVREVSRFNQKQFDELVPDPDVVEKLLRYVLRKNAITIKEEEA